MNFPDDTLEQKAESVGRVMPHTEVSPDTDPRALLPPLWGICCPPLEMHTACCRGQNPAARFRRALPGPLCPAALQGQSWASIPERLPAKPLCSLLSCLRCVFAKPTVCFRAARVASERSQGTDFSYTALSPRLPLPLAPTEFCLDLGVNTWFPCVLSLCRGVGVGASCAPRPQGSPQSPPSSSGFFPTSTLVLSSNQPECPCPWPGHHTWV